MFDNKTYEGLNGCARLRKERHPDATALECNCQVNFTLDEDWNEDVYFYYRLTEFYQNHRRYVRSVNNAQLRGELSKTSLCDPFKTSKGKKIAPCGMIANSKFNGECAFIIVSQSIAGIKTVS